MSSLYNYVRTTLSNKVSSNGLPDFSSFHLISKLPLDPNYNNYKFIPTLHKTQEKPEDGKYFNHTIGCADDLVYFATKECEKNYAEFKALGIDERIKSSIMQASSNLVTARAKYIVISSFALGYKYSNPNIATFVNEHPSADPTMRIEYQIENYIHN
jgi:hypothetical protein